jgi:hypothetical protein
MAIMSIERLIRRAAFLDGIGTTPRMTLSIGATSILLAALPGSALAFNLYDGQAYGNDLEINLQTTLSYTPIFRVGAVSHILTSATGNPNGSEGDLAFQHGLVSNEIEILPILDIKDGSFGAHFSGEAYLNSSFLGTNQNDQPSTLNPYSIAKNTDFTSATRNVDGENARVLDAFVYDTKSFGANNAQTATIKVGRQTLLWGQSLFLANNGIAAGMAPVDLITASNNPNAQTQQIVEPVGQVVVTYQPNSVLTLQGYYQFEWAHDYFQGVGAYFSDVDLLDAGGERILFFPGAGLYRSKNLSPENGNGQFGASVQATLGNYDIGVYGLRYDSKTPEVYTYAGAPRPTPTGLSFGTYNLVYPRDIWIEGTSLSTTVGPVNVGAEISLRQHMNLVNEAGIAAEPNSNANSNPAYPVGTTWAGQVSGIYISPGFRLDPGGTTLIGEIGFNHVLSVTANKENLTELPFRSSTAAQFQFVISPTYYDVLPQLQLNFPVGMAYGFYGRSEVDATENNGTGTVNVGVTATYKATWIASVTYNDYIGAPNPLITFGGEPSLADRSYVLFNFQHTF